MKKIILHLVILIAAVTTYGQSLDRQWYIKPYEYLSAPSNFTSPVPTIESIFIHDVSQPNPLIEDNDGNLGVAKNDVFVIFDDGSYFNSHDRASWDGFTYSNGLGYYFPKEVKYLYYTNVYEQDEPDPYVEIFNPPSAITSPFMTPSQLSSGISSDVLSANHSLVRGKDVTIIIYTEMLRRYCEDSMVYNLCFDDVVGTNMDPPALELSPVFDQTNFIYGGDGGIINRSTNCIDDISLSTTDRFTYVNLRLPDMMNPDLRNNILNFTLIPTNSTCTVDPLPLVIMDTHDPNFVKVECVEEQGAKRYVKYRVQCTNDGSAGLNGALTFDLGLPVHVHDDHGLQLKECELNTLIIDCDASPPTNIFSYNSNDPLEQDNHDRFKVVFEQSPFLGSNQTASFIVCMRLEDNYDVVNGDLHLPSPTTDFYNQLWSINHFYDMCASIEQVPNVQYDLFYENVELSNYPCVRTPEDCDCAPENCLIMIGTICLGWIDFLVVVIGLLALLFFVTRKRTNP